MYRRYAHLEPLSEQMRKLMIDGIEHFGRLSSAYNNMLSISRVGVENGKREAGVGETKAPSAWNNLHNEVSDYIKQNLK